MVWKSKYADEAYTHGSTRIKRVFAWLPVRVGNDVVWLETFEIAQMYIIKEYPMMDKQRIAIVANWVNISKKIIK